MMGVVDETGTLEYGQVYVAYSDFITQDVFILQKTVICAKNPCFHPGDLRKFEAVVVPALDHMKDCIVFPQKGPRPHPDEMSGSDLDGDMYFVCWDDDLIPEKENQDPMDFPKDQQQVVLSRPVGVSDVTEFIGKYIQTDQLGVIANAHVVHADRKDIFSPECLELCKMHSEAVDFPKTGKIPELKRELRPKVYPDFMGKIDKPRYKSIKILGQLYRQCMNLAQTSKTKPDDEIMLDEDVFDSDMEFDGNERFIDDARSIRDRYNGTINKLLNLYGVESEAEIVTGNMLSLKRKRGYLRNEKLETGQVVKAKMNVLRKNFRTLFFEEFIGEMNAGDVALKPSILAKASAWYKVTYSKEETKDSSSSRNRLLSFPWVVSDLLCQIKEMKINRQSQEDVKEAASRTVSFSIGKSLYEHVRKTGEDRKKKFNWLQAIKETTLQIIHKTSYDFNSTMDISRWSIAGLMSIGLVHVDETVVNIQVDYSFEDNRALTKFLRKAFKNNKPINNGRTLKMQHEADDGFVKFSMDEDDRQVMEKLDQTLRKNIYSYCTFVFLYDWVIKKKLIGGKDKELPNAAALAVIFLHAIDSLGVQRSVRSRDMENEEMSKHMLMLLKTLCQILVSGKTYSLGQLEWKFKLNNPCCNNLKTQLMRLYCDIARYHTVQLFDRVAAQQNDHIVMNLPMEIWGSLMFAEAYTARQIQQTTKADVSIRCGIIFYFT